MWADAHEAYQGAELDQSDHLSDLVNNEYGRKAGREIRDQHKGIQWSSSMPLIIQRGKEYIDSGNWARPSDFQ